MGEQLLGCGGSWNPIVNLAGVGWERRQWLWKMSDDEGRNKVCTGLKVEVGRRNLGGWR